jgi:aspyridone synthetase (hybrid polyketide synthase/nonribosomal peptide synthetase)
MTGELGLSIASWMIKNGARHIVLTSRNTNVDTRWLKEMSKLGANVQVFNMDVSDRSSVHSVVGVVKNKMPPIGGVCNAAMVLSDKLFFNMDVDTLNNTLRPKVDGTRNLDEIFGQTPLEFFILFSSLASIIGNAGQSNYHAANLFMASLASQRRTKGLAASVIHIGLVTDVGYVARKGQAMEEHLRKLFFMPLSESDVHHFFAEAVLAGRPDSNRSSEIIIGLQPVTDSPDTTVRPPWAPNPRFSHFVIKEASMKKQAQTISTATNIKRRIEEADSEESLIQIVQSAFSSKLEAMMQLPPDSVNVNIPLIDLGCDSLLAAEIRTWFLRELRMDIPVLKVLSGDTVAQICEYATKKFLALKLNEAEKERAAASTRVEDAVTVEANQPLSSVSINQDREKLDSSDSSDSKCDTSSDSNSEKMHSLGLSTPPSLLIGSETPPSVLTTSFNISKDGLNNCPHSGNENSIRTSGEMSYAQSRLWFLSKYLEDPTTYNVTVSYKVKGNLQISRLNQALAATISRHQSLQTCFFEQPENGSLMQGVLSKPSYLLRHVQYRDNTGIEQEFEILRKHLWDLEKGQTFGVTIVSQGSSQHTIIFGYHHIVMDGVSWHIFLRDLDLAYQMQGLPQAPKQYIDFSREQLQAAKNGDFESELQFWKEEHSQLPGLIPLLPIARTKTRTALHNYDSHVQSKELSQKLVLKIKRASQKLRATPFHFHLAIIQVIFSHFLDIDDLCIGVAEANRTDDDVSETVGFFLNLLPLRFEVGKNVDFPTLVQRTSRKIYAALSNSKVPFDLILDKLNVVRSPAYSPLFQVAVNYRMGALLQTPLGDCNLEFASAEDAKNPYDISFGITDTSSNTCLLELNCQNHLYTPEASKQLMDTYVHLLESLSTDSSMQIQDCTIIDPTTIDQALSLGRGPRSQFNWPVTLSERFDNIQAGCPNDIAVKDKTGAVAYSRLAQKVTNIALTISNKDLDIGTHVAILCEPSSDSIACMLAILRTGCVYVPLDLSLPVGRHASMLQNCKPELVLYHPATQELALELTSACGMDMSTVDISQSENTVEEVKTLARPNIPAFLLYTSGSTGTPKGIILSQANFVNHLAVKIDTLSIGKEVILQQSSLGFDMSIIQTFCALANGGTLVVAPREARGDPVKLSMLVLQERVTFTIATPSEYLSMLQYGNDFLKENISWNRACMGGETVNEQLMLGFQRLNLPHLLLTNCYGPTEITAAATFEPMSLDFVGRRGEPSFLCFLSLSQFFADNPPLPRSPMAEREHRM